MKLAHLYYFVGQYKEAGPQYLRALTIREQVLGPDHLGVAHSTGQLARMYHLNPEFNKDAESLYLRALAIEEKVLGENHSDTAERLYRLADFYREEKRPVVAEPLYERAMSILDVQPALETRWMRSGYAEFLRETGRESQAAELEERWGGWNAFEEKTPDGVGGFVRPDLQDGGTYLTRLQRPPTQLGDSFGSTYQARRLESCS